MPFVDIYMQDVQQLSISRTVVSNDYVVVESLQICGSVQMGPMTVWTETGLTRFWVMRATKDKETMPANAVADLNMALAHR